MYLEAPGLVSHIRSTASLGRKDFTANPMVFPSPKTSTWNLGNVLPWWMEVLFVFSGLVSGKKSLIFCLWIFLFHDKTLWGLGKDFLPSQNKECALLKKKGPTHLLNGGLDYLFNLTQNLESRQKKTHVSGHPRADYLGNLGPFWVRKKMTFSQKSWFIEVCVCLSE